MGLLSSLVEVMGKIEEASGKASVACDRSNNGGIERNERKKSRRRRLAGSSKQGKWQLKLAMAELFISSSLSKLFFLFKCPRKEKLKRLLVEKGLNFFLLPPKSM